MRTLQFTALISGATLLAALVAGCGSSPAGANAAPTQEPATPTPLAAPPTAVPTAAAPTDAPAATEAPAKDKDKGAPAADGGVTVNVVAKETDAGIVYSVDTSAVPAGKVTFNFRNEGKLTHELMVYPLQDLSKMMDQKHQGLDVEEMDYIKGMAGSSDEVDPGGSKSLEVTLAPGLYELACHVAGKNKDGSSFTHFEKGQLFTLAVTGPGGPSADIATPADTLNVQMAPGAGDLTDSWLFAPDRLVVKAGDVAFKVTNTMKDEHDFVVYPVGDVSDAIAKALKSGEDPDYDAMHAQVIKEDLEAGKTESKSVKLTPGVYVAACFMVSKNPDGTSFVHMERGQRFTFTVK